VADEGTRGYQPLVAVWAEEQRIVADECRDGNVAGGEDPLSSATRAFGTLPGWVKTRDFRGDSASYYTPLLTYLVAERIGFSISADMTPQLRAVRPAVPTWEELERRSCEHVDIAEVACTRGDWSKDAEPLRYVALRLTPLQPDLFAAPGSKYLAVVSNRSDLLPAELVRWHWEKVGTIEHVHRVVKDELGAGVMPSGRFGVSAAWFRINALPFNVLTVLKRRALPERLRFEVFTTPGKLAVHQSRLTVRASAAAPRRDRGGPASPVDMLGANGVS
jgi:hypothetical protein